MFQDKKNPSAVQCHLRFKLKCSFFAPPFFKGKWYFLFNPKVSFWVFVCFSNPTCTPWSSKAQSHVRQTCSQVSQYLRLLPVEVPSKKISPTPCCPSSCRCGQAPGASQLICESFHPIVSSEPNTYGMLGLTKFI